MRKSRRANGFARTGDVEPHNEAGTAEAHTASRFHPLFAVSVYGLVAILAASFIALLVVRHNVAQSSLRAVSDRTAYTARIVIPHRLTADDLQHPLTGARLRAFEEASRHDLLSDGTRRVKIFNTVGLIVYASDHRFIGKRFDDLEALPALLAGKTKAKIVNLNHAGAAGADDKVIEAYAPIALHNHRSTVGFLEQYSDYGLAAGAIRKQAIQLSFVLLIVLSLLYISLLPILRRSARTLASQNKELHRRTEELSKNIAKRAEIEERLHETIAELRHSEDALALAQEETTTRLAIAVESRNLETGIHIERMGRYCALLGKRLGWPEDRVTLMRMASPLHDVGKIGIADAILLKPGALTAEERRTMQDHAEIGHRILAGSESPLLILAANIALTHHEKWDGTGYPNGLAGEDIPVEGRVAAVADVFDALTSDRVYRPAMEISKALKIMADGRGSHFDPTILDTFFDTIDVVIAIRDGRKPPPPPVRNASAARRQHQAPARPANVCGTVTDAEDGRRALLG